MDTFAKGNCGLDISSVLDTIGGGAHGHAITIHKYCKEIQLGYPHEVLCT